MAESTPFANGAKSEATASAKLAATGYLGRRGSFGKAALVTRASKGAAPGRGVRPHGRTARRGSETVAAKTEKIIPFRTAIQMVIGGKMQKTASQTPRVATSGWGTVWRTTEGRSMKVGPRMYTPASAQAHLGSVRSPFQQTAPSRARPASGARFSVQRPAAWCRTRETIAAGSQKETPPAAAQPIALLVAHPALGRAGSPRFSRFIFSRRMRISMILPSGLLR